MSIIGSALGRAAGWLGAPAFGLVSLARRARTFHPRGATYVAAVEAHPNAPAELASLAVRLSGPALVRFSGALWKHAHVLPDVLGCAIRFRASMRETAEPSAGDQDLLFATIRRPWTMPFAPLTTNVRDYLANDYFAVSPFDAALGRQVYLRVHPGHRSRLERGPRAERLDAEAALGDARFELDVSNGPYGPWSPAVTISLGHRADVDDEALRFRPFRTGRGVRPRGFVHALRRGVYAMSQLARPAHRSIRDGSVE